jgi:energy-coupling factor transport system permease protein
MFQARDINTFVHKLHPLTKLLLIVLTVALILITPGFRGNIAVYTSWLCVLLIFWVAARFGVREASFLIKIWLLMAAILIVSQGFLYWPEGSYTPLFTVATIDIAGRSVGTFTLEGLLVGVVGSLKILCVLVSVPVFIATTKVEDFAYSLAKLGTPYKFTFILLTAMRFLPVVQQTWNELIDVQRLRGYDLDRQGIITKIREVYLQSIISLVLITFKSGLSMQVALETRGFSVRTKRTQYFVLKIGLKDYLVMLGLITIFILEIVVMLHAAY